MNDANNRGIIGQQERRKFSLMHIAFYEALDESLLIQAVGFGRLKGAKISKRHNVQRKKTLGKKS